ncbi:divalent metal cation transporter [Candidatus Roizmanbacteria bacterium]|nr:divalent metal cation transporter [Candidatus Roizmanbacteria bacterium]
MKHIFSGIKSRLFLFLAVFGPATITAMADNDASGVATYSIAGAKLGYPILFILFITTILLAVTQEMGMRLAVVTRKGLGDLIREQFGIKTSFFIFLSLLVANMGTIIVDVAAIKTTSSMLHLPIIPSIVFILALSILFIIKGNYKTNQNIMLVSCLFYFAYIFSAIKSNPNWGDAASNLLVPHGVSFTPSYWKDYIVIGMGVLGTTITPWGQFFISSFSYDKKIDLKKLKYSQFETYWGAFLTNFFSFFMVVATAATLYFHAIPLVSGEQAALAIKPFAGDLAGTLFAVGILNAGFMGIVTVSLSTAYAFSEFFGLSGSLDASFQKSKVFYAIFIFQLVVAGIIVLFPFISLFKLVIATQALNAMTLPFIFYYLIKLTSNKKVMGEHRNSAFQTYFAIGSTILILFASIYTLIITLFNL